MKRKEEKKMKKKFGIILGMTMCLIMIVTINYATDKTEKNTIKTSTNIETAEKESRQAISETQMNAGEEVLVISQNPDEPNQKNQTTSEESNGLGLIAVALATGLACIGSGIAVAVVGSSAVGAISENPSLLGKTIIFAGLAEGIAIYGLIISIMILNKI